MELKKINENDLIFSLDIGTRSIKATVGIVRDKKFAVIAEKFIEHKERAMVDGQIHDINLVASTVRQIKKELEDEIGCTLKDVAIAAAGRFLKTVEAEYETEIDEEAEIDSTLVRSLEMSAVKNAETEINKTTEGKLYCVGYSVKNYYLNSYIISNLIGHKGATVKTEIIATFLPRSVVDSLYSVMNKVNLKVVNLTLEPIAAMEAVIPNKLRLLNLALIDIGAGTSDIAICSDDSVSAYGMVPLAGDEITEAIAQNCLVDFNTAESIKKQCTENEEVTYTDVLGLENTMKSSDILKVIDPLITKMAEEVGTKIVELNGGKSPSAVFLVGGGSHTPFIRERLAEKLNIQPQRIAIKGRDAVTDCVCENLDIGSTGVTVLGIALVAIKNMGKDFIDVTLNDNIISLFNSHKHTIMDVLIHAEINPKILMARNGKTVRFTVNGSKRLAFGELGRNSVITLNDKEATLETEVTNGDEIKIQYAVNGKDAAPKVLEFMGIVDEKFIYYNDKIINLEPLIKINGEECDAEAVIKNGDDVEIIVPKTISDIKKYVLKDESVKIIIDECEIPDDYEVTDGERLHSQKAEEKIDETVSAESKDEKSESVKSYNDENIELEVKVNGEKCILKNKKQYIFVDVFNFIDFDTTLIKGSIKLLLNGKEAAYTDVLKKDDEIRIFWE
ncbi:MAG: cell division FtsA domain-containing protein [Inconstantimicrobium porci]|uniref:cell division protein FtsA n=1 Tax=Inconstantimicrobium porci TaxID=2652291 RepID=UPI002A90DCFA|nr:cell division FtsA domain-containing protein [Inconstantimicrobium porci]MDY5912508.1 cell division FtsA domain-containing protein [Inconstantimicrobium porci]